MLVPIRVTPAGIAGCFVVDGDRFDDERGFFRETFRLSELTAAVGRDIVFRQNNHSRSQAGVLRGFHAEPWDKLLYVVRGLAQCVIADVRPESPTFGSSVSIRLGGTGTALRRVFVAAGLANAFLALEETDYLNDVSAEFSPVGRRGFAWDDATLAVDWPLEAPVLSETDRALPALREAFPDHALFANSDPIALSGAVSRHDVDRP
jgi:dTDP-4-dehydrorhamnose 3,5-epimerase